MTFKEKLKQEHPEKVDEGFCGGCKDCPCDYHYEKKWDCKGISCEECWNREMPALMTAEEAWEIAHKILYMDKDRLIDVFGVSCNTQLFSSHTPQEAKAKFEEWESKQIRVGDVVSHQGLKGVVTRMEQGFVQVLTSFGTAPTYTDAAIKRLVKTGKHIDIQSVLEQIGGDGND